MGCSSHSNFSLMMTTIEPHCRLQKLRYQYYYRCPSLDCVGLAEVVVVSVVLDIDEVVSLVAVVAQEVRYWITVEAVEGAAVVENMSIGEASMDEGEQREECHWDYYYHKQTVKLGELDGQALMGAYTVDSLWWSFDVGTDVSMDVAVDGMGCAKYHQN